MNITIKYSILHPTGIKKIDRIEVDAGGESKLFSFAAPLYDISMSVVGPSIAVNNKYFGILLKAGVILDAITFNYAISLIEEIEWALKNKIELKPFKPTGIPIKKDEVEFNFEEGK